MTHKTVAIVLFLLAAAAGRAGGVLHIKNRAAEVHGEIVDPDIGLPDPGKRLMAGVSRVILQFEQTPGRESLEGIAEMGGEVLGPVPEDGLVVLFPDGARPGRLPGGVVYVGRLMPADKVSPQVSGTMLLAVEFFPDVQGWQASMILQRSGIAEVAAVGLSPHHKLVRGGIDTARSLAAWNETAYVFPGVEPGAKTSSCGANRIGQFVASSASSWSSKKEIGATLGYFLEPLPDKVAKLEVQRALDQVLAEWNRFTNLEFQMAEGKSEARTLSVRFAAGAHGDSWPFDGPGRVMAHAFYPMPMFDEPQAGDVHLDLDEAWEEADVYSVLLHEVGHALGLVHADDPVSVMYPMYRRVRGLSAPDVVAIRELYGLKRSVEEEEAEESGEIGLEVTQVFRNIGDFAPGELVAMTGKARGVLEGMKVRWKYGSGGGWISAVGAYEWSAPLVPIFSTDEEVVVEVKDGSGRTASQSVRIVRTAPAPDPE